MKSEMMMKNIICKQVKVTWIVRVLMVLFTIHYSLFTALAQTLTASAPSQVSVGEQFRLTYTVNTQDVGEFRAGNIPDALEVLIGPNRSTQSSFQMINGHTSSSSSITFTYIVAASKNGIYTIPPAHISVGGKTIASKPLTIKVTGTSVGGGGAQSSRRQNNEPELRDAGSH